MEYWAAFFSWVAGVLRSDIFKPSLDLLQALSVIVASVVAVYGINAWRRELKGKREYELAEEVLTLFYRSRDIIKAIRSPFGTVGEGRTRKQRPSETPNEKEALDRAHAVVERYEKNKEPFERLYALRYRFMTVFGRETAKPFDDLNQIIKEIFSAAYMLGLYWNKEEFADSPRLMEARRKTIEKNERVFWQWAEDDPISDSVDKVIREMEDHCKRIIQG